MIPAVAFFNPDVSGPALMWDQENAKKLARRYGYTVVRTVTTADNPMSRLMNVVRARKPDAVFVPSLKHFDEETVPRDLVAVCDVITVANEQTYARRIPSPFDPSSTQPF